MVRWNVTLVFVCLFVLGTISFFSYEYIIQENSITGYGTYYSTNSSAPYHIERLFPWDGWEGEVLDTFIINVDKTSFCTFYTNYSGSWAKLINEKVIMEGEAVIYVNLTKPGFYSWNFECTEIYRNNTIKAHKRDWEFRIIEPVIVETNISDIETNNSNDEIINQTQNSNSNVSNDVETNNSNNVSNDDNLDNDVVNNSDLNSNSSDANESNQCSGCLFNDVCYESGSVTVVNNNDMFCDSRELSLLKTIGEECVDDYQCISKYCANSYCRSNNILTKLLLLFGLI